MKRTLLTIAVFGLLSGCSSTSEILEIAPNHYTLTGSSEWTDNAGEVRLNLIQKAKTYCTAQGKGLRLEGTTLSDGGKYKDASATLDFSCE